MSTVQNDYSLPKYYEYNFSTAFVIGLPLTPLGFGSTHIKLGQKIITIFTRIQDDPNYKMTSHSIHGKIVNVL